MPGIAIPRGPQRIVCLTEEATEWLYLLGEEERIVGISGYTVRPRRAREEKPKVSAFLTAKIDKILALRPDCVFGFSDLQADIAAELVKRGYPVMVFNQRSVTEILQMIRIVGGLVGRTQRAEALVAELERGLADARERAAGLAIRPRVFFEEWDAPLISGIRWVEELVEIAGGVPVFPELREAKLGKDRIVDPREVARRAPDLIVASWCGKPVRKERIRARQGWLDVPAVQRGQIREIKSALILQPGPAALTEGLRQLQAAIAAAAIAGGPTSSSGRPASETGN